MLAIRHVVASYTSQVRYDSLPAHAYYFAGSSFVFRHMPAYSTNKAVRRALHTPQGIVKAHHRCPTISPSRIFSRQLFAIFAVKSLPCLPGYDGRCNQNSQDVMIHFPDMVLGEIRASSFSTHAAASHSSPAWVLPAHYRFTDIF